MTFSGTAPIDGGAPRSDSIAGLTARVIAYRSVELALFEIIGGWITTGSSGLVRAHAAAWSQHHAWHAELWAGRLPRTPLLDAADRPVDATDAARHTALTSLFDPASADGDRISLYAHGALAALDEALSAHLAAIDPALDGPTIRVLDLVLADVRRDRATAGSLADTLGDPDESAIRQARARVAALLR